MAAPTTPRVRRIRSLVGAVIAAAGMAGGALAQPLPPPGPAKSPDNPVVARPLVGIIDLRGDPDSLRIARVLADAIVRRPELQPVADVRVSSALVGPLDDEDSLKMADARHRLDQARDQMANLQLDLAVDRAREGRELILQTTPSPAATSLLADLVLTEGQAYFANQKRAQARAAFALVHRLTPRRGLDPNSYLPELVEAFAAAATTPTGTATLEIAATGTVWLDGHPRAQGSQTLEVAPGTHVVIASGPELLPSGERVDVVAGQKLRITLPRREAAERVKASRARRALIGAPDATARAGAMRQIAALLQLTDAVIVTADGHGNPAVQLWRDRAPGFQEIKPVARTLSPEAADQVIAPLVPNKPPPVADDKLPPIPFKPFEKPKQWYQKRWVQAGMVGGAIALIAGVVWAQGAIGADLRPCCASFGPGATTRE